MVAPTSWTNGPVIIVGAGVAGLTLALHLFRARIPVVVVEQRPAFAERGRTSTLQPWALAMFEELGVLEAMLATGQVVRRMAWADRSNRSLVLDFADLAGDLAHPYRLHIDQHRFCEILGDALPLGTIHWDKRVSWIEQDEDGVVVQLHDRTRVHGSFVVGADGLASSVRDLARVRMEIADQVDVFGSITCPGSLEHVDHGAGCVHFHSDTNWTVAHRIRGGYRLMFRMRAAHPNRCIQDDAWLQQRLEPDLGPIDLCSAWHRGAYTVQHRIAHRFGDRRVLLVGDAAHVTFPVDGTALNTGLADAKLLAHAFRSNAPAELETYIAQRPRELRPWVLATGSRPGVWSPNDGFPDVGGNREAEKALLLGTSLAAAV